MTKGTGFTLIELLIAISIVGILFAGVLPTYSHLIDSLRLRSAISDCAQSLQLARTEAILQKIHVSVMNNNGSWQAGWTVFVDTNANGVWDIGERKLFVHSSLSPSIRIVPTTTARHHVIYGPSGETTQPNGGFQADSLYFCPVNKSLQTYKIVISKVGRIKTEQIASDSPQCAT